MIMLTARIVKSLKQKSILWLLAFTKETPVKSTPLVSFIITCWAYVACRVVRKLFSNPRVLLSAATCIISSPDFVTASNWRLLLLLYMYFVSFSNRPSFATADNEFSHGKPKIRTRATDAEGKNIILTALSVKLHLWYSATTIMLLSSQLIPCIHILLAIELCQNVSVASFRSAQLT